MKLLLWIGVAVLVLGLASLVVPIPRTGGGSIELEGVSVGIETQHDEKVSPMVSVALILGGAGLMVAGMKMTK